MTGRLLRLLIGLWLYGATMAMMVRAGLGLNPWDVLHEGITHHVPVSFGVVTAVVGVLVLLAWIPLRQRPGVGTVLNVLVIGVAVDVTLAMLPEPGTLLPSAVLLAGGVVGNAFAGALYVSADLGPGPRDGLWVALVARTGRSVRVVRTCLELSVLALGWVLGGTVGIGTVAYALAVGPLAQRFLRSLRWSGSAPPVTAERAPGPLRAP
ncbi:hypothetical protein EHW97_08020 [Aeromicrobium camelliae]|uniref:YitT family protein n=1 Tax=Aeromicrobium camelliae TaxID=1538144 RepID=A0A3N6X1G8_9ACTN|nr:hypothetical protein [Aeromicrobium camelliae]RQN07965.1 hypothetical protein EHW97_08020 [Aeromicrobium camelliae]